jgi:uncharacterized radical SAM superfamily protein
MHDLYLQLKQAREISWQRFGKRLTVYLPGMFSYDGIKGKYPAISITGSYCGLQCDHCKGAFLPRMVPAKTPEELVTEGISLASEGNHGILISGGCDREGRLPWQRFIRAIGEIKERTDLLVSIHSGILDESTAKDLKGAGVDQALMDVIGDDKTYRQVCHVDFGVSKITETMEFLTKAGISIIPHVICGLGYGRITDEKKALQMISPYSPEQVVIVSLMPLPGTPMWDITPPSAGEVGDIISRARLLMPDTRISLGCARKRGDINLEITAIDAGVNRMALPSEEALSHAKAYGLDITYQKTCCSVSKDLFGEKW